MTWEQRDLPVLRAIVELTDEGQWWIEAAHLAQRTGFDEITVQRALNALAAEDPPFFEYRDYSAVNEDGRRLGSIHAPSGHARRAVGTWPTANALVDRIIAGLNEAAEAEEDEDRRNRLQRTAAWFGGAGREVLLSVISGAITG
jgi:hypothetical protein